MTIANGYATLAEFKAYAKISSTDATDDGVIEDIIEAASRYVDRKSGRTFYARSETRYFDMPFDSRELRLDDDLLTITTLTNGDGTAITSTYYNLIPKNATPYNAIKIKETASISWTYDSSGESEAVISVAGTWGYSATRPDDINLVCLAISQGLYKRRFGENSTGTATITAAGVVITPDDMPSWAWALLQAYRRML